MMTSSRLQWERKPASALLTDDSLRSAWDRLNAAALTLPFMHARTITAALACFGSGSELLLMARDGQAVVAMLIVVNSGLSQWSTFQPSQLPLGAWVAEPSLNLADLLHGVLRHALPGFPLVMSLTQVDCAQAPQAQQGQLERYDPYIETSWINVEGGFEDYWALRGKNLRQNLRKQRNKLAADGVNLQMHWFSDGAQMGPALDRYGALEGQGWKADQGTAIESSNAQGRFYKRVMQEAAAHGEAWVSEYRFNDRTVAMNLGLMHKGMLVVLKTAYDETIPRTLSPASLLREDELKRLFDEGQCKRIEFYGRTMEWHTKLTEQKRALYHLTAYRFAWLNKWASERKVRAEAAALAAQPPKAVPKVATTDAEPAAS